MCGYADQSTLRFDNEKLRLTGNPDLAERMSRAIWMDKHRAEFDGGHQMPDPTDVGGIGDNFVIHMMDDAGEFLKDWSRFGMKLPLYPGKETTYFNAKIETLEKYHEQYKDGGKPSKFGQIVYQVLMEQPCIMLVNSFFEADKEYNTGYYKIERKDQAFIPLAGFFGASDYNDMTNGHPGHCLITRDPYPSIQQIGHHRSPVILRSDMIESWLDRSASFQDRLEMVAAVDQVEYTFQMVEKKAVTRRSTYARDPLPDGIKRQGTLSQSVLMEE